MVLEAGQPQKGCYTRSGREVWGKGGEKPRHGPQQSGFWLLRRSFGLYLSGVSTPNALRQQDTYCVPHTILSAPDMEVSCRLKERLSLHT